MKYIEVFFILDRLEHGVTFLNHQRKCMLIKFIYRYTFTLLCTIFIRSRLAQVGQTTTQEE